MSAVSNAELIATYESLILANRVNYATAALVLFEHILSLKYEIDFFWKRRWSAATWLFIFNRYLLLGSVVFQIAPTLPQICDNPRFFNALYFLTAGGSFVLLSHAFTILRTFAVLQGRSWRLAVTWTLIALTLAVVTLDLYQNATGTWMFDEDPIVGSSCIQTGSSAPQDIISRVNMATTVISIISASLVLIATVMQTARQVQQTSTFGLKTTLSRILLRDGSLFFLIILAQNIFLAIPTLNGLLLNGPASYVITQLFEVLPRILLSRFIINLRQVDAPGTNPSANQHFSRFSMPNLRIPTMDDVIGNLGEPLDFVEYRVDDEDAIREHSADSPAEQQDAAGLYAMTGVADVEAAGPSGSGSCTLSRTSSVSSR